MEAEIDAAKWRADKDLTEGSTDTEAEAKAANANEPHPRRSKRRPPGKTGMRKREKRQGKGGATEIIKATDKDKEKK